MDEISRRHLIEGCQAGTRYALAPPPRIAGQRVGNELGRQTGQSLEFLDHRDYTPGDDLRHIDWHAYARTDRLTVKLYRQETAPHLDLLLDTSASMALAESDKRQAAVSLAGLFASAAENSGFTHLAWACDEHCRPVEGSSGPGEQWLLPDYAAACSPAEGLLHPSARLRTQAVRVLISDLLFLAEPARLMRSLAADAAQVHLVQLLAEGDAQPPPRGSHRLIDSETGAVQEVYIDASAQQTYRDALARHQQHWARACREVGATLTTVLAEPFVREGHIDDLLAADVLRVA